MPSIGQIQHLQFGFARIKEGELFYDEDSGFSDSKKSLEDLGVSSGDILAIWKREVVNDESPRKRFRRTVLYFAPRQADEEGVPSGRRGCCGLHNLGNTCYMNAALQCLSHTALLTEHVLSDSFQSRAASSKSNKKLVVAASYAEFLKRFGPTSTQLLLRVTSSLPFHRGFVCSEDFHNTMLRAPSVRILDFKSLTQRITKVLTHTGTSFSSSVCLTTEQKFDGCER